MISLTMRSYFGQLEQRLLVSGQVRVLAWRNVYYLTLAFCFFGRICPPRRHIFVWGDDGLPDCRDGDSGDDVCVFAGLSPWA